MAKPVNTLPAWASNASFPASNYPADYPWPNESPATGREPHPQAGNPTPWSGASTKDATGLAGFAAAGHEPGVSTSATKWNQWLAYLSEWIAWVEAADATGTEDDHLVETTTTGQTALAALQVGFTNTDLNRNAISAQCPPSSTATAAVSADGGGTLGGFFSSVDRASVRLNPRGDDSVTPGAGDLWCNSADRLYRLADQRNGGGTQVQAIHTSASGNFGGTAQAAGGATNSTSWTTIVSLALTADTAPRVGATMWIEFTCDVGAAAAVLGGSEPVIDVRLYDATAAAAIDTSTAHYTCTDGTLNGYEFTVVLRVQYAVAAGARTIEAQIQKNSGVGPQIQWRDPRLSIRNAVGH